MNFLNDGVSDFEHLYYRGQEKPVKLTNITEVAIHPKPIERQKVAQVLQIFNKRTNIVNVLTPNPKNGSYALQNRHPAREMFIIYHNLAFTLSKKKHFNYVHLSQFFSDPIEKGFSKLMQGPGRANFVNVWGIFDKLALKKSQLYLIFNK